MSRKRISTVLIVLTLVVLVAAGSWMVGSSIQSPAEVAARTAPPTPSPILVPVEERVLTSDVVTRGTARFGRPRTIALAPSPLKAGAGVITTLPEPGTQLIEGSVLLTASGRPLFVLQGEIPVYRDLVPGIGGDDVRQLETALERLGFDPGPIDGLYDEQTGAAVRAWYRGAGWPPFAETAGQRANIRALEQELDAAMNARSAAADAAARAPLAVDAVRARIEAATLEANTEASPQTDSEVALANALAAQLVREVELQSAIAAQTQAEREARTGADRVTRLTADLVAARRDAGTKVPLDEIVFIPVLPVRVAELSARVGDTASGPALTVTNNRLAVDSSLPLEEVPLVRPGMPVAVDEPSLGFEATGVISRVAPTPGTDGVDGFHVYFEVAVDETPLSLDGFSLRLTIPVESTGGMVTAVPISALSLAADGTSRVQIDDHGSLEYVVVEPGLSADGFVEVTAVGRTLSAGQLVVIGFESEE